MATKEEKIADYTAQLEELGESVDEALLEKVTDGLGPANYQTDASLVSATDPEELERVYTNFVADELSVSDKDAGMTAIDEVMEKMSDVPRKHRAVVYYLLTKKLG